MQTCPKSTPTPDLVLLSELDVDVQSLRLERGEAISDGQEARPHSGQMFEALLEPKVRQIVGKGPFRRRGWPSKIPIQQETKTMKNVLWGEERARQGLERRRGTPVNK